MVPDTHRDKWNHTMQYHINEILLHVKNKLSMDDSPASLNALYALGHLLGKHMQNDGVTFVDVIENVSKGVVK